MISLGPWLSLIMDELVAQSLDCEELTPVHRRLRCCLLGAEFGKDTLELREKVGSLRGAKSAPLDELVDERLPGCAGQHDCTCAALNPRRGPDRVNCHLATLDQETLPKALPSLHADPLVITALILTQRQARRLGS